MVLDDLADLEQKLAGRECYGGLDLARVNDLSAFVLLFPPTEDPALGALADKWTLLCWFWVPEEDILRRGKRDRVPYATWRDQGFLIATPGNATDFAFVEPEIIALSARFDLRELAYPNRWQPLFVSPASYAFIGSQVADHAKAGRADRGRIRMDGRVQRPSACRRSGG